MKQLYIVTRAHNQDYISATAYLTEAEDRQGAIINCMQYEDLGIDEEEKYEAELIRLRALSLYELEQDDCHNGNVWAAQLFEMPTFT